MEYDALGALFRRIVLASAPLLGAACDSHTCRNPDIEEAYVLQADAGGADGGFPDLIARCEADASDCGALCAQIVSMPQAVHVKQCERIAFDGGGLGVRVVYMHPCVGGRAPAGFLPAASAGAPDPLGRWLATCAQLEAASIDAFDILAAELSAHHGPPPLIEAARAAATDERRHAEVMSRLAARHGAAAAPVRIARGAIRDIESIARENAVEGCARETYGALLAWRQAQASTDPEIRAAMAGLAGDEARHAALAWTVDAWIAERLTGPARRRVREARHEAYQRLLAETQETMASSALVRAAGLPDQDEAARMVTALHSALPS
jgi:hypothetical protein